ncbi:MAG: Localization factor PodJS, partial [Phenylobacterium sp.]
MTAGAPWSVKGIDPKAREVAKDLARRSGMTLGEWLNRMILEDEGDDAVSAALFGERAPEGQARPVVEAPPRTQPSRYEPIAPRYETGARVEAGYSREEIARVALALDRLTDHIEASETRTGLAISGVEQSVRSALTRLDAAERQQGAAILRIEESVDVVRGDQIRIADRIRKAEHEASGPRSAEALKALEATLAKVAGRLDQKDEATETLLSKVEGRIQRLEGGEAESTAVVEDSFGKLASRLAEAESRTAEAMQGLRESFVALDSRLKGVETSRTDHEQLESLAARLSQRLEEARAEIAAQLTASAEDRFDRIEGKLGEMAGHVDAAEHRSAAAIETMGKELAGVAQSLGARVEAAEAAGAKAIDLVGSEVARIGDSVEARLARSEGVQADALGKLSAEITRISERLTERISNAERRSAQAIDEVGEQVSRVSERIGQRADRVSDDLSERIRASEERTAKLLEEAREKIDLRLAEAQARLTEQVKAAVPPTPTIEPALPPAETLDERPGYITASAPAARPPRRGLNPMFAAAFPVGPAAAPAQAKPPVAPPAPEFDETDFEAADGLPPTIAADGPDSPVLHQPEPAAELDPIAEVMKAIGAAAPEPAAAKPEPSSIDAELMAPPALEPAPSFDAPSSEAESLFEPELDDPFEAAPPPAAAQAEAQAGPSEEV